VFYVTIGQRLYNIYYLCEYTLDILNRLNSDFEINSHLKDFLHLWTDCRNNGLDRN